MTLTLTDTVTAATWRHSFTIDIPKTIGGTLAYVGFTGATGADVAVQQILNWTFTNSYERRAKSDQPRAAVRGGLSGPPGRHRARSSE